MKIIVTRITDEPMGCEQRGCKEESNGLNRHSIDFGKGFVFELWLCNKHTKQFKERKKK